MQTSELSRTILWKPFLQSNEQNQPIHKHISNYIIMAGACWHRRPFRLIYLSHIRERGSGGGGGGIQKERKKERTEFLNNNDNTNNNVFFVCFYIMANTCAIGQQVVHTIYRHQS